MASVESGFLPWSFSDVDLDQPAMNAARLRRGDFKEKRHEILQEFIQVICEDETMHQPYLNIDFLMRFLRSGKFLCDRAHKRMKKYYDTKREYPEVFRDFLPSCTLRAQSLNHISVLPSRARDNSIVLIYKIGLFDPDAASFEEVMRLDRLVLESLLLNHVTQLCGVTLLIDFTGFTFAHVAQFTPQRIETIFRLYHSSNALRIGTIHILNAFGIASYLFDILRASILSEKMRGRVFSHSSEDWTSLHAHLPPHILPEEYSGDLKSNELVCIYDLVNHNEDFFQEQLNLQLFET